jgi:hypothetical protein
MHFPIVSILACLSMTARGSRSVLLSDDFAFLHHDGEE